MIQADIQWREQYVSHALNRKFTGVVDPGVYQGFECKASGGDILVGDQAAPNTAVVEVNGYSVTARMDTPEQVTPSAAKPYVVLEVYYGIGIATRASLKAVAEPAGYQLVLCRVTDDGAGSWDIDLSERQLGRTQRVDKILQRMSTSQLDIMSRHISLAARVTHDMLAIYERIDEKDQQVRQYSKSLSDSLHERADSRDSYQDGKNSSHAAEIAINASATLINMVRHLRSMELALGLFKASV